MIKLIYTIIRWFDLVAPLDDDVENDPLSHPAIRDMGPDELADLPFSSMRERRRY